MLTYIGDPGRHYPTLGITPTPGEAYDVDDPGDGRWQADAKPSKPEPADAGTKE